MKCRPVGTSASPIGTCRHPPVVGSQESKVQASPSSQLTGVPLQIGLPAARGTQKSPVVHRLPSSHAMPATGVYTQVPDWHASTVHGLLSSHWIGWFEQAPVAGSHRSAV